MLLMRSHSAFRVPRWLMAGTTSHPSGPNGDHLARFAGRIDGRSVGVVLVTHARYTGRSLYSVAGERRTMPIASHKGSVAGFDSAAGRWARYVANGCTSEDDFKTLGSWARFIGVSCSSLCESCRMLGIRPRDARDFTRMLRALIHAGAHRCSPLVLLNVSDRRTLRKLLERSGLRNVPTVPESVDRFLEAQRLVPRDREEVRLLRMLLFPSGRPL
jgi:hypothetical protein